MRKALMLSLAALSFCAALADATAQPRQRGARHERIAPPPPDDDYFSNFVTGPGGTKTPIMQVPGSASVVTRKMMDDFQARDLCDALRFSAGVSASGC